MEIFKVDYGDLEFSLIVDQVSKDVYERDSNLLSQLSKEDLRNLENNEIQFYNISLMLEDCGFYFPLVIVDLEDFEGSVLGFLEDSDSFESLISRLKD